MNAEFEAKQAEEFLQTFDAYQEILAERRKAGTLDSIKDKLGFDQ